MNEIDKSKIIELSSNDYKSNYKKENVNLNWGNILPLVIPFILILFSSKSKQNYKQETELKKNALDNTYAKQENHDVIEKSELMVDKLSNAIDLVKKVNKLNDIKKLTVNNHNSLDGIQEAFSVIRNIFSDTANIEKLDTLENTISTMKKFNEMKKILDMQKSFSANKNKEPSIDSMVEAISPLLPEKNVDNLKNLQKVVKMANLISSYNNENNK